ncbi:hypothetical protein GCM10010156_51210 [Planobispora rosea]|uniref:Uncharacterized protein n=1 Tax=Planobispora rosea TaxID=35762 RepID=A0A8J3SG30_PLARO|nr:DUF6157 family protein [Planobispora rosea]GGS86436.1 hypothetical protein GCM10010156_51210 [Planobispora rosea]GIH89053.1 hypothetical protein Pro02_74610 [Planobispora rosea]
MDLNYYDTLIAVADDCPVDHAVEPPLRGGKKTVAVVQFEMIDADPGVLTQEDVLFESWLRRQEPVERSEAEIEELRAQFFAKSQACLRASPLPKQYGWGLLFDQAGRVRLCPMESAEYQRIVAGEVADVKVLKAMRSRRA